MSDQPEEFFEAMLRAISDVTEQLEDREEENNQFMMSQAAAPEEQSVSFKKQKEQHLAKLTVIIDEINDHVEEDNLVESSEKDKVQKLMKQMHVLINFAEEVNLKSKLCHKRALNLTQILLKQCAVSIQNQPLVLIAQNIVRPAISSKDSELQFLALECVGLLCLLDR